MATRPALDQLSPLGGRDKGSTIPPSPQLKKKRYDTPL